MQHETVPISKTKRYGRSAVSNGTRLLERVDGRSRTARRFRDLVNAYCAELGWPYDALTEAQRNAVRQAASAQMQSEGIQAAMARGEAVDTEQLVRLSNLTMRLLRGLGLVKSGNDDDTPDLRGYLESGGATA